ncbi:MAG TPA: metallophosphoesterase [Chthoniobacterales bacterium]|jgi:Icc-related predicted phosphoesterase
MSGNKRIRIAAVGDIHYTKNCKGRLKELFTEASQKADILAICGDFTDYGLPEEASVLAEDLESYVHIPAIGVIGNHDFESGKVSEVKSILKETGLTLLDGESVEFFGVGFAGVCGFGGGFAPHMLNAWGEPIIKDFVQETIEHALCLEKALARVGSAKRVVLLHYSPTRETVEGESPEIYPFLGSSRLEQAIDEFEVSVVFHGHAHNGKAQGKTSHGVPVFNVALPVTARTLGKDLPIFFYEL